MTATQPCHVAEVHWSSGDRMPAVPLHTALDAKESFVALLAGCHMLWFITIAKSMGFQLASYADAAVGTLETNARGNPFFSRVALRPTVAFSGPRQPSMEQLLQMHAAAQDECFVANSVSTEIVCEPCLRPAPASLQAEAR